MNYIRDHELPLTQSFKIKYLNFLFYVMYVVKIFHFYILLIQN